VWGQYSYEVLADEERLGNLNSVLRFICVFFKHWQEDGQTLAPSHADESRYVIQECY